MAPDKALTLPAFSIEVDGKIEKTNAVHVRVKKLTQTLSSDYKLSMNVSNKTPMVGEKIRLHVRLVYKNLADYEVITPVFSEVFLKELSDKEYKNSKGEWVEALQYEIMPQKSGKLMLYPVKAKIELSFPKYKRRNIYSNALELTVLAIPQNFSMVGTYKMNASVNTKYVRKNQPVKYTLILEGSGNMNNFNAVNIAIPHASVYAKKIQKVHKKGIDIYKKSFEIV